MKANTVLTVQRVETPANELEGVPDDQWGDVCQVFAEINPLSGREYYQAQQMESTVTHRLRTHYIAGADNRMRLIKPNEEDPSKPLRTFEVESVVNVGERNRWLEWMCKERT